MHPGSDSEVEPADIRVGELVPDGTTIRKIALVIHGNQPFAIGRSACDFVIDDPRVSSTHVEICYNSGKVFIKDTSSNGTFINGSKIEPGRAVSLQDGDRLAFVQGDNPIRFVYKSARARKSPTRRSANRQSRNQSVSRPSSPSRNSLSPARSATRHSSRHRSPSGDRRSLSASVSRRAKEEDKPKEEKPRKEESKKKKESKKKGDEKRGDVGKGREEKEREISPSRERKKERELRKSKLGDGAKKKKKKSSKKKDETIGITPDAVLVSVTGESKMIKRGEGSDEESSLSEIEARDGSDTDPETEVSAALLLVGRFRNIVDVRDRTEMLVKKYPRSFIGKEAVTAMVENGLAADRIHACRVANILLQAGIFDQLGKKDNEDLIFKDAVVYYQFTKLQAAKKLGALEPTKETKEANGDAIRVEVCSLEGQPFCFGRAYIEDERISTKHFEIILERKELFIRDTRDRKSVV